MPKPRCCSCQSARGGTCNNCACAKNGKGCTDCLLSKDGLCLNPNGCGGAVSKPQRLVRPYTGCVAGKNGKPLERRREDISRLRVHVSEHLAEGFVPPNQWLLDHDSQVCPGCARALTSVSSRCTECKSHAGDSVSIPKARFLPKLQLNHVVQVSLGATNAALSSGLPPAALISPLQAAFPPLQAAFPLQAPLQAAECSAGDEGKVYEVEKIVDKRRKRNKVQYRVVWRGCPGRDTWEEIRSLSKCKDAINDYERTHFPPACVAHQSVSIAPAARTLPQSQRNRKLKFSMKSRKSLGSKRKMGRCSTSWYGKGFQAKTRGKVLRHWGIVRNQ